MKFAKKDKVLVTEKGLKECYYLTHTRFFETIDGVVGTIVDTSVDVDKKYNETHYWYLVVFYEVNQKYWIEEPNLKRVEE